MLDRFIGKVRQDAAAFGGAKAARRIIGFSKVSDIETPPKELRVPAVHGVLRSARLAGLDGDTLLPLHQLGLGPTAAERRAGITTAVPGGLWFVWDDKDLLHVGYRYASRRPLTRTARAQVACTAVARGTGTSRVRFPGDRRAYTCADFRDLR